MANIEVGTYWCKRRHGLIWQLYRVEALLPTLVVYAALDDFKGETHNGVYPLSAWYKDVEIISAAEVTTYKAWLCRKVASHRAERKNRIETEIGELEKSRDGDINAF